MSGCLPLAFCACRTPVRLQDYYYRANRKTTELNSWKLRRCSRHTVTMEKLSTAIPDTDVVIDLLQEAASEEEDV
jgi:hypothetical protein